MTKYSDLDENKLSDSSWALAQLDFQSWASVGRTAHF